MIELLSPAGNFEKMRAALLYGADAVYLAGNMFGMRSAADNFTVEELFEAAKYTHERGKKLYLTLNTLPLDREIKTFLDAAYDAAQAGIDALIVADLGGAAAIRRTIPTLELHASTQASGHNADAGWMLAELGFSQCNLG